MVSNPDYVETNLDDERFQAKPEKLLHCYRHISGATLVTCPYSTDDDFLFGKHKQWFCQFRPSRCLHKCKNCSELERKCLENEDCTETEEDKNKQETRKSFFSIFSKKNDYSSTNNENENLNGNDNNEKEKKIPKKIFFSIFGQDIEDIEQNQEENPIQEEQKDTVLIQNEEQNTKEELEEKKTKKKSLFSKKSKKEQKNAETPNNEEQNGTNSVQNEEHKQEVDEDKPKKKSFFSKKTKTEEKEEDSSSHTDTTGEQNEERNSKEEIEEENPKKKSFFSKKPKKEEKEDESSSHINTNTEQNEEQNSKEEIEEEKPKKKSFFSKKPKKEEKQLETSNQDDTNSEEKDTNALVDKEQKEEISEDKHKKKSLFSKKSKNEQKQDENTSHEDINEGNIEETGDKSKKNSFFSKKSNKEHANTTWHDESSDEEIEEHKNLKKKSFFSRFSKKDITKDIDSDEEHTKDNNVEHYQELGKDKKENMKSFFSKFSKSHSEEKELESETAGIKDVIEFQENSVENKENKQEIKRNYLSRFPTTQDIPDGIVDIGVENDTSTFPENHPEDIKEKNKKEKKKSIFSRSKKDDNQTKNEDITSEASSVQMDNEDKDKEKTKKKKSFFSKSSKKEEIHSEVSSVDHLDANDENNEKGKKKKSFFSKSSKKEDINSEISSVDQLDTTEDEEHVKKKKSFFSKSSKNEEKSFLGIFSKKYDASDTENHPEVEVGSLDKLDTSEINKRENDKKETSKDEEKESDTINNTETENQGENIEINLSKEPPKRERRKSFLGIFNKKEEESDTESNIGSVKEDKITKKNRSKSKQDLSKEKTHEIDVYKKKYFENCEVCFQIFKDCPNNCFNCYKAIQEYNWFDHSVLKHAIMMETRETQYETVALYLQAKFDEKMYFCFTAFDFTFFLEFIFSSGSIIINMLSNMEDYALKYFKCNYTVSWLDLNFAEEFKFTGKEFWDWNVHTILADKAVDDKFFGKCKLVIKISTL